MGLRVGRAAGAGGGSATPWRDPMRVVAGAVAFDPGSDHHIIFNGGGTLSMPVSPTDGECVKVTNHHSAAITVDFQSFEVAQLGTTTDSVLPGVSTTYQFNEDLDLWFAT